MTSEIDDEADEADEDDDDEDTETSVNFHKIESEETDRSPIDKSSNSSEASSDLPLVNKAMNEAQSYSSLVRHQMLCRIENREQNDDSGITPDDELERDELINQMGAKVTKYYRNVVDGKLTTRTNIMQRAQKELDDAYEVLGRVIRKIEKNVELEPIRREVQNLRKHTKMIVIAAERLGYSESEAEYIDQLEQVVKAIDCLNNQHEQAMCELHKLRQANARLCSLAGSDNYQCRTNKQEMAHHCHPELPRRDDNEMCFSRKKAILRNPSDVKILQRTHQSPERQVREFGTQSESSGSCSCNADCIRHQAVRFDQCEILRQRENVDPCGHQAFQLNRQVEEKATSTTGIDAESVKSGKSDSVSQETTITQETWSWTKILFYCGLACILLAFILGFICRLLSIVNSNASCINASKDNIDPRQCGSSVLNFFEDCTAGKLMEALSFSQSSQTDFNVKEVQPQFTETK